MKSMGSNPKSSLNELLREMEPEVDPDEFVYCTVPSGMMRSSQIEATCRFSENEGDTLILRRSEAERNKLAFTLPSQKITVHVHSSLEAIGFIARVATELAKHGIGANCVSAFYHDHLFVQADEGERALRILRELQQHSESASSTEITGQGRSNS